MSASPASRSGLMLDGIGSGMRNARFNDLLWAFRSSLMDAQAALKKDREAARRRQAETDGAEGDLAATLCFTVPKIGFEASEDETLSLPASSFRPCCRPLVTGLSLSFECELTERWFPGAEKLFRVVIPAKSKFPPKKAKRWHIQVQFDGAEDPHGEVRLDGAVLMRFPEPAEEGERQETQKGKASPFSRIALLFRNLLPEKGFLMDSGQSIRTRQILAESAERR